MVHAIFHLAGSKPTDTVVIRFAVSCRACYITDAIMKGAVTYQGQVCIKKYTIAIAFNLWLSGVVIDCATVEILQRQSTETAEKRIKNVTLKK